jgi:ribonuclease HII
MITAPSDIEKALYTQGFFRVAGVDEAGRGPLAGPVVAAAVILPCEIPGVNDSKKLSEKRRAILAERIINEATAYAYGIVPPETIDKINILQATLMAMKMAIENLQPPADYAIIDGNALPNIAIPSRAIIKGDALSHSIAAAAILAKTHRDEIMRALDSQYPHYGFARHKGYGTAHHMAAIRLHGISAVHRRSFCK